MAKSKSYLVDPVDADLNGFADEVTGAAFTLTANESGDSLAHRVSILNNDVTDHSGKTVTLVGTDADGEAITEAVTGPTGSATVTSAGYFLTLTSATPSATIGTDTFDIGWVDEVITQTIPLNFYSLTQAALSVSVTGTIDFTVQETLNSVLDLTSPTQNAVWYDITALADKTANTAGAATLHSTGVQLAVNSYTTGADLTLLVLSSSTSR